MLYFVNKVVVSMLLVSDVTLVSYTEIERDASGRQFFFLLVTLSKLSKKCMKLLMKDFQIMKSSVAKPLKDEILNLKQYQRSGCLSLVYLSSSKFSASANFLKFEGINHHKAHYKEDASRIS